MPTSSPDATSASPAARHSLRICLGAWSLAGLVWVSLIWAGLNWFAPTPVSGRPLPLRFLEVPAPRTPTTHILDADAPLSIPESALEPPCSPDTACEPFLLAPTDGLTLTAKSSLEPPHLLPEAVDADAPLDVAEAPDGLDPTAETGGTGAIGADKPLSLTGGPPSTPEGVDAEARLLLADDQILTPEGLDPAWNSLLDRLAGDGFDRNETAKIFAAFGPASYTPGYMAAKVGELHGAYGIGIARNARTFPDLPPGYTQPAQEVTVGAYLELIKEHSHVLDEIKKTYGVQSSVIFGILLIETALGKDLGHDVALRALASMAATTTPAMLAGRGNAAQARRVSPGALAATLRRKSDWAYNEVKALLEYGKATGYDVSRLPGSYYGAIGLCQFMPSNIMPLGADGDGDGRIDLFSLPDAMTSIARYLDASGWRNARTLAQKMAVIRTYNDDGFYASSVLETEKRLALAEQGKIKPQLQALVGGGGGVPSARLNPSLRRLSRPAGSARIRSLGDYGSLLQ